MNNKKMPVWCFFYCNKWLIFIFGCVIPILTYKNMSFLLLKTFKEKMFMKKLTILAMLVGTSFASSAAVLNCPDGAYDTSQCKEVESGYAKAYAEAKEGDVITIKDGMPVPVTPESEVISMFDIVDFRNCDTVGDVCEVKGFGLKSLLYKGDGEYTVTLEDLVVGAKYFVEAPSCPSASVASFVFISEQKEQSFTMLGQVGAFTKHANLLGERLWSCGQPFVVTKYND